MKRFFWWGWGAAFIGLMALMLPTVFLKRQPTSFKPNPIALARPSLAGTLSLPAIAIPKREEPSYPRECVDSWRALASWDLTPLTPRSYEITDDIRQGNVKWIFDVGEPSVVLEKIEDFLARDRCVAVANLDYDSLVTQRDQFTTFCHDAIATKTDAEKVYKCIGQLVFYRAYAIEALMKGTALADISDAAILANMLFASGLASEAQEAEATAKIAERLAEVDPQLDEAVLASLQFRYAHMRADFSRLKGKRDRLWYFDKALEEATARFEGGSASIFLWEMRMNRERLEGNLVDMRRMAEKATELWPTSPLGTYYLGWVSLLEGDKGIAQRYAALASEMEPLNLQFSYAHMIFTKHPDSVDRSFHERGGSMSFYFPDGKSKEPIYGGGYAISPDMILSSDLRVPLLEMVEE